MPNVDSKLYVKGKILICTYVKKANKQPTKDKKVTIAVDRSARKGGAIYLPMMTFL